MGGLAFHSARLRLAARPAWRVDSARLRLAARPACRVDSARLRLAARPACGRACRRACAFAAPRASVRLALLALALGLASCQGPPRGGALHEVRPGETIYAIARQYGVSVSDILEANDVDDVRALPVGTRLVIPGAEGGAARASRAALPVLPAPELRRQAQGEALVAGNLQFAWPLRGELTSGFGRRRGRQHDGIDLVARRGTLVRAAEAGRVIFADRLGDYGLLVVVRHGSRFATVYAHNRRNRVRRGAFVDKGAVLAELGDSGNASAPHLHFEIRRDDRPEDPLLYLP